MDRTLGIGGSDVGKLLGLHPTEGPRDVYNEKLGLVPPVPQTALMEKGHELEPIAAKRYERETGQKLRKVETLVHSEFAFLRGNIDREIVATGEPWEAKCPTSRRFNRWKHEGLPQVLIAQLVFYAGLKQKEGGVWSIFNSDLWASANFEHKVAQPTYERMVEIGVTFWEKHIVPRIPPPEGIPDNPLVEFEVVKGGILTRVETPEFIEAMNLLREAKRHVAQASSLESLARERVREALGDRKGKYICEAGKLYWVDQEGRQTFNHKLLQAARPLDRNKVQEVLMACLGTAKFKEVANALRVADLDFEQFFKQGQPFEMMRPYFSNSSGDDEEED